MTQRTYRIEVEIGGRMAFEVSAPSLMEARRKARIDLDGIYATGVCADDVTVTHVGAPKVKEKTDGRRLKVLRRGR